MVEQGRKDKFFTVEEIPSRYDFKRMLSEIARAG